MSVMESPKRQAIVSGSLRRMQFNSVAKSSLKEHSSSLFSSDTKRFNPADYNHILTGEVLYIQMYHSFQLADNQIYKEWVSLLGGELKKNLVDRVTFVVTNVTEEKKTKQLRDRIDKFERKPPVVSMLWLEGCFEVKRKLPFDRYLHSLEPIEPVKEPQSHPQMLGEISSWIMSSIFWKESKPISGFSRSVNWPKQDAVQYLDAQDFQLFKQSGRQKSQFPAEAEQNDDQNIQEQFNSIQCYSDQNIQIFGEQTRRATEQFVKKKIIRPKKRQNIQDKLKLIKNQRVKNDSVTLNDHVRKEQNEQRLAQNKAQSYMIASKDKPIFTSQNLESKRQQPITTALERPNGNKEISSYGSQQYAQAKLPLSVNLQKSQSSGLMKNTVKDGYHAKKGSKKQPIVQPQVLYSPLGIPIYSQDSKKQQQSQIKLENGELRMKLSPQVLSKPKLSQNESDNFRNCQTLISYYLKQFGSGKSEMKISNNQIESFLKGSHRLLEDSSDKLLPNNVNDQQKLQLKITAERQNQKQKKLHLAQQDSSDGSETSTIIIKQNNTHQINNVSTVPNLNATNSCQATNQQKEKAKPDGSKKSSQKGKPNKGPGRPFKIWHSPEKMKPDDQTFYCYLYGQKPPKTVLQLRKTKQQTTPDQPNRAKINNRRARKIAKDLRQFATQQKSPIPMEVQQLVSQQYWEPTSQQRLPKKTPSQAKMLQQSQLSQIKQDYKYNSFFLQSPQPNNNGALYPQRLKIQPESSSSSKRFKPNIPLISQSAYEKIHDSIDASPVKLQTQQPQIKIQTQPKNVFQRPRGRQMRFKKIQKSKSLKKQHINPPQPIDPPVIIVPQTSVTQIIQDKRIKVTCWLEDSIADELRNACSTNSHIIWKDPMAASRGTYYFTSQHNLLAILYGAVFFQANHILLHSSVKFLTLTADEFKIEAKKHRLFITIKEQMIFGKAYCFAKSPQHSKELNRIFSRLGGEQVSILDYMSNKRCDYVISEKKSLMHSEAGSTKIISLNQLLQMIINISKKRIPK